MSKMGKEVDTCTFGVSEKFGIPVLSYISSITQWYNVRGKYVSQLDIQVAGSDSPNIYGEKKDNDISKTYLFTEEKPWTGIWSLETGVAIEQLGFVTLDPTCDPTPEPEPEIVIVVDPIEPEPVKEEMHEDDRFTTI